MLSSERPRNVGPGHAAGFLYGDWGTSRLYVLGLAFFFAGPTSFYLIAAMSVLILAVGWAYTQICRIYPDGGGVYSAARGKSKTLAVTGALLLYADYVVTASLSSLDAFHYFGVDHHQAAGFFSVHSPGLWAVLAIALIGVFNLLGPKHTGGFAMIAAGGMMFITLLVTAFALPQIDWNQLPARIGRIHETPSALWLHFVAIVLALSGVEAIGNLTGVMRKPVAVTARRSIWLVAIEVAVVNILLAAAMIAVLNLDDASKHKEDMLAYLGGVYIGGWGEVAIRAIGGVLLLSAVNTVITDMIAVQYLMSRDGELPQSFQRLNRFGVPWMPAILATLVPCGVLFVSHDLEHLAALYAIGVVGAVAINITLCSTHPRLHGWRRKVPMMALGALLVAIWITLAATKLHALAFVCIVLTVGMTARYATRWWTKRQGAKPSLLRQAIREQLPARAMVRPRILLCTYGSTALVPVALDCARQGGATLVVAFIREVSLSHHYNEKGFSLDTDPAALRTFARVLDLAHDRGVPVLPVYDTGADAAQAIAETAAMHGCTRVLIGSSRQGRLFHLIKGRFQRRLEELLPAEVPVQVLEGLEPVGAVAGRPPVAPAHP